MKTEQGRTGVFNFLHNAIFTLYFAATKGCSQPLQTLGWRCLKVKQVAIILKQTVLVQGDFEGSCLKYETVSVAHMMQFFDPVGNSKKFVSRCVSG